MTFSKAQKYELAPNKGHHLALALLGFLFDYIFCHFCIKMLLSVHFTHMFGRFYVGLHSAHLAVLCRHLALSFRHLGRCVFNLNTDREEVIWS